jgi:hypothetical protein
MAIFREGQTTKLGLKSNNPLLDSGVFDTLSALNNITYVRVTDIVLNEKHDKYPEVGEWNGIGAIFYQTIDLNTPQEGFALPLNSSNKNFPLINEVVLIMSIPSRFNPNSEYYETQEYYFNPTNIWNHPHHNAQPKTANIDILSDEQKNDYQISDSLQVRKIEGEEGTDIELNYTDFPNPSQDTFKEKNNIHPLLPFMGDILFEGRYGQSIRFGSTNILDENITKPNIFNNYSKTGKNGDPIILIRNGQPNNSTDEGWIPIVENIKRDLSSIYLTSTQRIESCSLANENFNSFLIKPTKPSSYNSSQIILNSSRILLNANEDNILISGQNAVGISSNRYVNLESTTSVNIVSPSINLGGVKGVQPTLKGDNTIEVLNDILNNLIQISEALTNIEKPLVDGGIIDGGIFIPAKSALENFGEIKGRLENLKTTIVKVR